MPHRDSVIACVFHLRAPVKIEGVLTEERLVEKLLVDSHLVHSNISDDSRLADGAPVAGCSLSDLVAMNHATTSIQTMARLRHQLHRFVQGNFVLERFSWQLMIGGRHVSLHTSLFAYLSEDRVLNRFVFIARRDHRAFKTKAEQYHHYRLLLENMPSGILIMTLTKPLDISMSAEFQVDYLLQNTRYRDCNSALLNMFDLDSESQLEGRSMFSAGISDDFPGHLRTFIHNDYQLSDFLCQLTDSRGEPLWVTVTLTGIIQDGYLRELYGVLTDVSERVQQMAAISYQANHDSLTGLPNRSHFTRVVNEAIESDEQQRMAIFVLDLDGFKEINDTLGHSTGDELLKLIGPRLQSVVNSYDATLSRLGGDEFALLLRNLSDQDQNDIVTLADALMRSIRQPFAVCGLQLCIGGSIGISIYPLHGADFGSLMRCADIAMYQAKRQSRQFELYDANQDHYSVRRLSLMMDLRRSIEDNQMRLHYQPIIDLSSGDVVGFEALVRWQHPEHGLLPPSEFVPLIELTDMIEPLTWWVLDEAMSLLKLWAEQDRAYYLSVNVSTRNIADDGFVKRMHTLLSRHQLSGHNLELEITEGALMVDPVKTRSILQALNRMGIRIAIDDYGTGYSSLAYLKSLPIDTLKIDKTFIAQMIDSTQDAIIVSSTIQLAHNLGLEVVAEGIESDLLLSTLGDLGCDKGQGYHVCIPVALPELETWLEKDDAASRRGTIR